MPFALAFAAIGATAAAAEPPGAFVDTFDRYCLPHIGDAAGLRRAAVSARFPPFAPASPAAMLARPGRVFDAGHHLLLLSLDSGLCGVMGHGVDGGAVLAAFASAMTAQGIEATPVGSAPDGAPQAYRLAGPTLHAMLMVGMHGAAPGNTTMSMLATSGGRS